MTTPPFESIASAYPLSDGSGQGVTPRGRLHEVRAAYADGLPPVEARLIAAGAGLATPVDERGLIVIDSLISLVNSKVSPEYKWPSNPSRHHLYWPRCDYQAVEAAHPDIPAVYFRELSAHKIRVPRYFENWLHAITAPPEVPDPDVIRHTVAAWTVASSFFSTARRMIRLDRQVERALQHRSFTPEQQAIIDQAVRRNTGGIALHLAALERVPPEYRPFAPDRGYEIAAGQIGDVLIHGWQRRTRAVTLRTAA
jgi:hypothetical protein